MSTATPTKKEQANTSEANSTKSASSQPDGLFLKGKVSTKPETREIKTANSNFFVCDFQVSDGESEAQNVTIKADSASDIPVVKLWSDILCRVLNITHNQYSGIKLSVSVVG